VANSSMRPVGVQSILLFAFLLVLYLLTLSSFHLQDSIEFSLAIERGYSSELFHAFHLMYMPLGFIVREVFAPGARAIKVLQVFNCLIGALTVTVFWYLLRRIAGRTSAAWSGALLLAFAYGFWYFATEAETYGLTILWLLLSYRCALDCAKTGRYRYAVLLGVMGALAILFHITSILFVVVAVTSFVMCRCSVVRKLKLCGTYVAVIAFSVAAPYLLVARFALGLRSPGAVVHWLLRLFGSGLFEKPSVVLVLPQAVIGLGRTAFGGLFALRWPFVDTMIKSSFHAFDVQKFITEAAGIPIWSVILATAALLVALIALLFTFVSVIRRRRELFGRYREPVVLASVWLASYFAFFVWYSPWNIEFWPFLLIPACSIVAMTIGLPSSRQWHRSLAFILAGSMFVTGFFGNLIVQRDAKSNALIQRAQAFKEAIGPNATVVTYGDLPDFYLRYYWEDNAIQLISEMSRASRDKKVGFAAIRSKIEDAEAKGRETFISSKLFNERSIRVMNRWCGVTVEDTKDKMLDGWHVNPEPVVVWRDEALHRVQRPDGDL